MVLSLFHFTFLLKIRSTNERGNSMQNAVFEVHFHKSILLQLGVSSGLDICQCSRCVPLRFLRLSGGNKWNLSVPCWGPMSGDLCSFTSLERS